MQFSDRARIENGLFHPYKPYGSTARDTPFIQIRREIYYKQSHEWDAIFGSCTDWKRPISSVRTVRIDNL